MRKKGFVTPQLIAFGLVLVIGITVLLLVNFKSLNFLTKKDNGNIETSSTISSERTSPQPTLKSSPKSTPQPTTPQQSGYVACPSSPTTQTIKDTSKWATYNNKQYGFEVKYPNMYVQGGRNGGGETETKARAVNYCYNDTNFFTIYVYTDSFANYKLIDHPGGFIFHFDTDKKEWLHENNETSKYVPTKVDSPVEAYKYSTGDVGCRWDTIVIPHPSYSYIVEIINSTCTTWLTDKTVKPTFTLEPEQILATFKFID